MGGMADPKIHSLPHMLPLQIWYSTTKGIRTNRKEPQTRELWDPPLGVGLVFRESAGVADP